MASSSASLSEPPKSKLYTRTGDKGTSGLYNGERRAKDDVVFEALGSVDELNSFLGVAREYCSQAGNGIETQIDEIQSRLLDIGSVIATPLSSSSDEQLARVKFDAGHIERVEKWIDSLDATVPPLRNFILPSGGLASSNLHVARTACRRAERRVVPLVQGEHCDVVVGQYLNRLSDYLFAAARFAAHFEKKEETVYKRM